MKGNDKITIGFDVDGVLADFVKGFTTLCNKMYGTPILNYSKVKHWNFEGWYGLTKEQLQKVWKAIRKDRYFWNDLRLLISLDESDYIGHLTTQANVVFITSRPGDTAHYQTAYWIEKYFNIRYPQVIVTSKKGLICAGLGVKYFIDDKVTNCINIKEISPKTKNYLLTYPHSDSLRELLPNYFINNEIICVKDVKNYLDILEQNV